MAFQKGHLPAPRRLLYMPSIEGRHDLQAMVESLLSEYPNVLVLRVRMPIVGDLLYPRNFITKIIKYEKVILWSHTVL